MAFNCTTCNDNPIDCSAVDDMCPATPVAPADIIDDVDDEFEMDQAAQDNMIAMVNTNIGLMAAQALAALLSKNMDLEDALGIIDQHSDVLASTAAELAWSATSAACEQ